MPKLASFDPPAIADERVRTLAGMVAVAIDPEFAEAPILFLRAARAVADRRLDLPQSLRDQIAERLQKCGIPPVRAGRVRDFVPVERAERLSLYGEALPPGLILSE